VDQSNNNGNILDCNTEEAKETPKSNLEKEYEAMISKIQSQLNGLEKNG